MKDEKNFETDLLNTQDVKATAAATLAPDASNGDKIKALRTAQHMSMAELARRIVRSAILNPTSVNRALMQSRRLPLLLESLRIILWMKPPSSKS